MITAASTGFPDHPSAIRLGNDSLTVCLDSQGAITSIINRLTGFWSITLTPRQYGGIGIILDPQYSYVWAVAKDGRVSNRVKIAMEWSYS